MAVKIRLARGGMKKAPRYRVVVQDEHMPRDGRFIESVGRYDPTKSPSLIELDLEKIKEWLGKGAKPTQTVQNLIDKAGSEN
ncbi:MAG: 30S ribosomal protein S16 [Nitrospinaceae bacterium]|nr:30S ribosomal protein S16 [Nitrospinaceae bacterium]MBT3434593.1 30S ribosomal protein S16 [Nitrospinaceae bacterium]MBT3821296.1 30S ribosomal protein S16 [Nitrospinaceae bacterium]MBT4094660.1 30S ribosomal protein S16 [Nitrospinaceae bacterium]MBT4431667.1 30S ribosomal protein S16 [Nitrospinaceae bacterium]